MSSKLVSGVSAKNFNQVEGSMLSSPSASEVLRTRLHSSTQITSSHEGDTSSLVKGSLSTNPGKYIEGNLSHLSFICIYLPLSILVVL